MAITFLSFGYLWDLNSILLGVVLTLLGLLSKIWFDKNVKETSELGIVEKEIKKLK